MSDRQAFIESGVIKPRGQTPPQGEVVQKVEQPAEIKIIAAPPETEVLEITGIIKSFNDLKQYGFISTGDGSPDVFLHVNCLRTSGYETARPGAKVRCRVVARPKGLAASHILSMEEATALDLSHKPQNTRVQVIAESDWENASVKLFCRKKGFGFLVSDVHAPDIFVHMETLKRFGFDGLSPDQIVQVRWGTSWKGRMVAEIRACSVPPT